MSGPISTKVGIICITIWGGNICVDKSTHGSGDGDGQHVKIIEQSYFTVPEINCDTFDAVF